MVVQRREDLLKFKKVRKDANEESGHEVSNTKLAFSKDSGNDEQHTWKEKVSIPWKGRSKWLPTSHLPNRANHSWWPEMLLTNLFPSKLVET